LFLFFIFVLNTHLLSSLFHFAVKAKEKSYSLNYDEKAI